MGVVKSTEPTWLKALSRCGSSYGMHHLACCCFEIVHHPWGICSVGGAQEFAFKDFFAKKKLIFGFFKYMSFIYVFVL
jgi:hypothetical protein